MDKRRNPRIEVLNKDREWVYFQEWYADWDDAVKEVYRLNSESESNDFRGVYDDGCGLTCIDCSGFYYLHGDSRGVYDKVSD